MIPASGLSPVLAQNAWINEFHYDNTGGDVGEFIEIVVENAENYSISSFQVILYNGADGLYYSSKSLSAFSPGSILGNHSFYSLNYTLSGTAIQNGDPDGIALLYNGTLIPGQFLSYEGVFTALDGPVAGTSSIDIGVDEEPVPAAGLSLRLSGSGTQYSDFTWQEPAAESPGTINPGQALTGNFIANPLFFNASTYSESQINLSWNQNANNNDILLAWSSTNIFGIPTGTYTVGDTILGGGRVLFAGNSQYFNHTGLNQATRYFYTAWSVNTSNYSSGVSDSACTRFPEPSGHPDGLAAQSNGPSYITVSWTDADAAHYLIKGNNSGYGDIVEPTDGVPEADAYLVRNVDAAVQKHRFTGLTPDTRYYFKVYPYNGQGVSVNYKTQGSVPQTSAITHPVDLQLLISEVADPIQSELCFIELYNAGNKPIDFSLDSVYVCRQSYGNPALWESVLLTGSLQTGKKYVIACQNTNFDTAYLQSAGQYSAVACITGNDGIFLYYGGQQMDGYRFDAYGTPGVAGDTAVWNYTGGHAVRKRYINTPDSTFDQEEWVVLKSLNYYNMTPGEHAETATWQGNTSSQWNKRGLNWSGSFGFVPDASYTVIIPDQINDPEVTSPSACHRLELENGSMISVRDGALLHIVGP